MDEELVGSSTSILSGGSNVTKNPNITGYGNDSDVSLQEFLDPFPTDKTMLRETEKWLDNDAGLYGHGKEEVGENGRAKCCADCHESVKSIETTLYRYMEVVQSIKSELEVIHKKVDNLSESGVTDYSRTSTRAVETGTDINTSEYCKFE